MGISQRDRVRWETSQGTTSGIAEEKRTQPFQHAKQEFIASEDDPYWIVKSDKTDATAAHKESTLRQL